MLLGIGPQLALEQLPGAVEPRQHRPQRHVEHEGDLFHVVSHHVYEHEGKAIELGKRREHRADVVRGELVQEVEMDRIRVRERIVVRDLAEERELVDPLELDLLDATASPAPVVTAAVDEDAREPVPACLLVLELREAPIGAEKALLDGILGLLADQSPGKTVKTRKLALGKDSESVGRWTLAVMGGFRSHHSTTSETSQRARLLHRAGTQ